MRTPGDESYIPQRRFDSGSEAETEVGPTEPDVPRRKRGRPPKSRANLFAIPGIPKAEDTGPEIGQSRRNSIADAGEKIKEFAAKVTPKGNRLSQQEVKALHDPLTSALFDEFDLLDKMLWGYGGDATQQPIWSDITEKEMEAFVSAFLGLGQKSGTVATMARSAVDLSDYVIVGAMMAPRIKATVEIVKQHRKNAPTKRSRLAKRDDYTAQR